MRSRLKKDAPRRSAASANKTMIAAANLIWQNGTDPKLDVQDSRSQDPAPPTRAAARADLETAIGKLPQEALSATYSEKQADWIDAKGVLKPDLNRPAEEFAKQKQLNCTTFATPLLHFLLAGTFAGFKQTEVNGTGDQVAAHHKLPKSLGFATEALLMNIADPAWRKQNTGVYFFDLRNPKDGHIGFLIVEKDEVEAVHFCGITTEATPKPGLARQKTKAFAEFIKASKYKPEAKGTITLYALSVPSQRK